MAHKPTLFMVTDIETTLKKRMMFDCAWRTIDRKGRVYSEGSFVIREAFTYDVPFFKEKLHHYFDDAYDHKIKAASIFEVREEYNKQIEELTDNGHRVIPCAYNAAFDFKYMPETWKTISGKNIPWLTRKVELMDIWAYWGQSVPLHYKAVPSASGRFYNTSAESAYRFEFMQDDFEERHIAWHDCVIESEILQKALARKKALPTVANPKQFAGAIWKKINDRLGVTGEEMLAA